MHWSRQVLLAAVIGWAMRPAVGQAVDAVASFLEKYSPGSISSYTRADRALSEAPAVQAAQEKAFKANRQVCYSKLVAETCLREAIEANAKAERSIRAVQVEAREFRRKEDEREARAARDARMSRDAADAPRKQAEREQFKAGRKQREESVARSQREFEASAPERAKRAADESRRTAEKAAARARKDADEKANLSIRAQRARDHEEKVRALMKRAQEKEEKERRDKTPGKPAGGRLEPSQAAQDVQPASKP